MPPERGSLDGLPVKNGFRLRGLASTRIETFTDAAFAFALTLLVVSLDVPTSYAELVDALRGVPAFALSTAILMMFWAGHHTWSRRYGMDDVPTLLLSCLLVFTVLVYVYPLRFLFQALMAWIGWVTGVRLSSDFIELEIREVGPMFVVYGAGFCAMCLALLLLYLHAWGQRDALQLDTHERFSTRTELAAWSLVCAAGLLSIVLALVLPARWAGLAGWAYGLLAIVMPIFSARVQRRERALFGEERP